MPRFSNKTFKTRRNVGKTKRLPSITGQCNSSGNVTDRECGVDSHTDAVTPILSSSKRKMKDLDDIYGEFSDGDSLGNEIIDLSILSNILSESVLCMKCGKCGIEIRTGIRAGLATELQLVCQHCNYSVKFFSSKKLPLLKTKDSKSSSYETNIRLVYALRSIGRGQAACAKVCGIMNLPPPPSKFQTFIDPILPVLKEVAVSSMKQAVEEAVLENDGSRDLTAAFDGSWHKRGHTSLNGVLTVTSVDTGKVLDVEVLTKHCRCKEKINNQHEDTCVSNYEGSSGGMEVAGSVAVCRRSVSSYGVRYINYLGDGDSKAFKTVQDLNIYGNETSICKLECVGHVQKRMGSRLRRLKTSLKGKKLSDGKLLHGKNRLTDAQIDQIQTYYGLAIRRNTGNLDKMKEAVWALYFHKASTNEKPQHGLCPPGENSWCKYRKCQINGDAFDHPHSLPEAVMTEIKPIFRDLAQPELLKKCLHGRTQNPNECVNSVIWSRIPKTTFVGLKTLLFGVFDAVACFNDGQIAVCKVLYKLGIRVGSNTVKALKAIDNERIRNANRAMTVYDKVARTTRRQTKRKLEDEIEADLENPSYGAGMF